MVDIESYLPGDLLPKADIASMAVSLELRSPFLDHRVVELGLALPPELAARKIGPVSLRNRVTELGGSLTLSSSPQGVELHFDLPT